MGGWMEGWMDGWMNFQDTPQSQSKDPCSLNKMLLVSAMVSEWLGWDGAS
jgi:hypothetical protein